jgi:UDP-N-acetylmuramoyl-tripeptide--D-alanyl-D-alanine ligase
MPRTAVGGRLVGEDRQVQRGVDRQPHAQAAGALFVALRGPKFDANEFVAAAAPRGAVGAIVDRPAPQARWARNQRPRCR